MSLLDQISVNIQTGAIAYPKLEGFELDVKCVYSTAELFLPHCGGNLTQAVRLAIHGQLAAHQGAQSLVRR